MYSVGEIAAAINDDFSSMSSSSVVVTINAALRVLHIIHLILRSLRFSSSLNSRRSKQVICKTHHAIQWQNECKEAQ